MVVEFETFTISLALLPFHVVSCTHATMIFLLCMMSAISLLFPVILPMFAVMKRTCRFCVLARFFIRSLLCCGSPSHTGTFGRGRGRSLEGDFLSLDFLLALSIIYVCLEFLQPAGTRRQPSSFIRALDRLENVLNSSPPGRRMNLRIIVQYLTSAFCQKYWKRIVAKRLNAHIEENRLSNHVQSAYKRFHSTETALLKIHNDIICNRDNGKVTAPTVLDLSAAFDTCNPLRTTAWTFWHF